MPPGPTPAAAGPADGARRGPLAAHQRHPGPGPRRRPVVEGVDVGEQHQGVGVHQVRHQGGQPVVVAEPDLVGGHRVVLVHHRHHAEPEQLVRGCAGRWRSGCAGPCRRRSAAPARPSARAGEGMGVAGHQQPLADAGRGLLGGQVARAAAQPQRASPAAMAPEETSTTSPPAAGGRPAPRPGRRAGRVDPALAGGQRGRPDLDHDPRRQRARSPCRIAGAPDDGRDVAAGGAAVRRAGLGVDPVPARRSASSCCTGVSGRPGGPGTRRASRRGWLAAGPRAGRRRRAGLPR